MNGPQATKHWTIDPSNWIRLSQPLEASLQPSSSITLQPNQLVQIEWHAGESLSEDGRDEGRHYAPNDISTTTKCANCKNVSEQTTKSSKLWRLR